MHKDAVSRHRHVRSLLDGSTRGLYHEDLYDSEACILGVATTLANQCFPGEQDEKLCDLFIEGYLESAWEDLPRVGTRVRLVALIDRYPLMGYDNLGNTGSVTLSTPVEIWVRMDGEPIRNLDSGWGNQIVLTQEALSGKENQGFQIATMADLFGLFFEVLPGEPAGEPG